MRYKGAPGLGQIAAYEISAESAEDHLFSLYQDIEQVAERLMDPILIIFSEVVGSKYNRMRNKMDHAQDQFDFAFQSLKRFFMCGATFIPQELPLSALNHFRYILLNLCHQLLSFDCSFINDRLMAFDWLSNVEDLWLSRLRNAVDDNTDRIHVIDSPNRDLPKLADFRLPDFFPILSALRKLAIPRKSSDHRREGHETIEGLVDLIRANIKMFEDQHWKANGVLNLNRSLCRQIESLADHYRRSHSDAFPTETDFSFVARTVPVAPGIVFVQHLFDAIYIYIPSRKLLRRTALAPAQGSFTLEVGRTEFSFKAVTSLFSPEFNNLVATFLLVCEKPKWHPLQTLSKIGSAAQRALFGDLKITSRRPVLDDGPSRDAAESFGVHGVPYCRWGQMRKRWFSFVRRTCGHYRWRLCSSDTSSAARCHSSTSSSGTRRSLVVRGSVYRGGGKLRRTTSTRGRAGVAKRYKGLWGLGGCSAR
jgi:hypothetical protein